MTELVEILLGAAVILAVFYVAVGAAISLSMVAVHLGMKKALTYYHTPSVRAEAARYFDELSRVRGGLPLVLFLCVVAWPKVVMKEDR